MYGSLLKARETKAMDRKWGEWHEIKSGMRQIKEEEGKMWEEKIEMKLIKFVWKGRENKQKENCCIGKENDRNEETHRDAFRQRQPA